MCGADSICYGPWRGAYTVLRSLLRFCWLGQARQHRNRGDREKTAFALFSPLLPPCPWALQSRRVGLELPSSGTSTPRPWGDHLWGVLVLVVVCPTSLLGLSYFLQRTILPTTQQPFWFQQWVGDACLASENTFPESTGILGNVPTRAQRRHPSREIRNME